MAYTEKTKLANIIPDSYIYISHLDSDLRFWKLPVWPDSVSDTMSSSFTPTYALGRSAPVYTYQHSGPRTVQVQLKMHREMMDDVNLGFSNSKLGYGEDYFENLVHALQSITVPKYNLDNKAVEPPLLAIRLGHEIFIKGILNGDIGITYEKPILYNDKFAQVSLSLNIAEVDPYDATEVYKNGSYRGMVNTLSTGALANIGIEA